MATNNLIELAVKCLGFSSIIFLMGSYGFSYSWIIFGISAFLIRAYVQQDKDNFIIRDKFVKDEKKQTEVLFQDIPYWVNFPDVERVEWLNKMIKILWPYVGNYIDDFITKNVEPEIKKQIEKKLKIGSFKFEKIELGDLPVTIGGIKVYNENVDRDEIMMDLELFYSGNCYFQVSVAKIKAGIKDVKLRGNVRVVMKPLTKQIPLIGAVQVFFLNSPQISYNLTETANVLEFPGLNDVLKKIVLLVINQIMVLPNKYSKKLIENIPTEILNYPKPKGVLRLKVIEARNLMRMDLAFLGKADPYALIKIGSEEFRTETLENTVNPKWDYECEAILYDVRGLSINVDVRDKDENNKDDAMGRLSSTIETLISKGNNEYWFKLSDAKSGEIRVEAEWFKLSSDIFQLQSYNTTNKYTNQSTCVLVVYVGGAKDLPISVKTGDAPNIILRCTVGNKKNEAEVICKTNQPVWDKGFTFLVGDPEMEELNLELLYDKENVMGKLNYELRNLLHETNLELSTTFPLKDASHNSSIQLHFQLLAMVKKSFDNVDSGHPNTIERSSMMNVPETRSSGLVESPVLDEAPVMVRHSVVLNESPDNALRRRQPTSVEISEEDKCCVNITMRHSKQKQALIVVVHKVTNLPCSNPADPPDPYVKLQLYPERKDGRQKTATIKNTCNPVFDETLEFPMGWTEVSKYSLILYVKRQSSSGFFSKSKLFGKVTIPLSEFELSMAVTKIFDVDCSSNGGGEDD